MKGTTIRTLPCQFTAEEKAALAKEAMKLNLSIAELTALKTNIPKRIAVLTEEVTKLSKEYSEGQTNRDVDCYFKLNHPVEGKKTLFRCDTEEEIPECVDMDLFDIDEGETIFKLLLKNFAHHPTNGKGKEYIELSVDEGIAVIKTVVTESAANKIIRALDSEFNVKGALLIEHKDYQAAKKFISDFIKQLANTKDSEPAAETIPGTETVAVNAEELAGEIFEAMLTNYGSDNKKEISFSNFNLIRTIKHLTDDVDADAIAETVEAAFYDSEAGKVAIVKSDFPAFRNCLKQAIEASPAPANNDPEYIPEPEEEPETDGTYEVAEAEEPGF